MVRTKNKSEDECKCGHEKRLHANPEKHTLGSSHCTRINCECGKYEHEQ